MKIAFRVLVGVLGLCAIVAGVRQMMSGMRQMTGAVKKQPQEAGGPISVGAHGCALRVPKGWMEKTTPAGGVMFVSPKESGYAANLIVMSEPFTGTLREYADANVASVKQVAPAASFTSDAAFPTGSGAPSFRSTFANKVEELDVTQAMYFFDGPPGRKIVVTTTGPAVDDAALRPLFDTCLRSLTLLQP